MRVFFIVLFTCFSAFCFCFGVEIHLKLFLAPKPIGGGEYLGSLIGSSLARQEANSYFILSILLLLLSEKIRS